MSENLDNRENLYEDPPVYISENDLIPEHENTDDVPVGTANFVTGEPDPDDDDVVTERSSKGGGAKWLVLTAVGFIVLIAVAGFFIMRGSGKQPEAVVKDNSASKGLNVNANTALPNIDEDYRSKYGDSTLLQASNSNTAAANTSLNGTTAPPYNNLGSILSPPASYNSLNGPDNSNSSLALNDGNKTSSSVTTGDSSGTRPGSGPGGGGGLTRVKPAAADIVDASVNPRPAAGRNDQVSLFFYDRGKQPGEKDEFQPIAIDRYSPAKPTFGAVLPVKVLGRLHTLGTNGLVRMSLTRSVKGSWGTIPSGTIFVGRVQGGAGDRVFVSLMGYIDSRTNRLITMGGDLQGADGALGLRGQRKSLTSRWSKVFSEGISIAKDLGSSYLLGRRGGGGSSISYGSSAERLPDAFENKNATKYVVVQAGTEGYLVINDLPPALEEREDRLASNKTLTDDEILKMIQVGDPAELQRIMPGLSPGAQQIAKRALDQ